MLKELPKGIMKASISLLLGLVVFSLCSDWCCFAHSKATSTSTDERTFVSACCNSSIRRMIGNFDVPPARTPERQTSGKYSAQKKKLNIVT